MKKTLFHVLGVLIAASSILSLMNPDNWYNNLPVVFALGCIVYACGELFHQ
jgi:hypothetical protein